MLYKLKIFLIIFLFSFFVVNVNCTGNLNRYILQNKDKLDNFVSKVKSYNIDKEVLERLNLLLDKYKNNKKVFSILSYLINQISEEKVLVNENGTNDYYLHFIESYSGEEINCDTEECILEELGDAMQDNNLEKIWYITQEHLLSFYGNKAGIPLDYNRIKYAKNTKDIISMEDLEEEYELYWEQIQQNFDENGKYIDGRITLFRDYTNDGINLINFLKAGVENKEEIIGFLEKIADNLINLQASNGLFGTPDLRDISEKELNKSEKLTGSPLGMIKEEQLERQNLNECNEISNCFENVNGSSMQIYHPNYGIQFDNGLVIGFLSMLYKETSSNTNSWNYSKNRDKYLEAVKKSAVWIEEIPCSSNFNYNSFSTYGLSNLYEITNDDKYLNLAINKMKFGVFPGLIPKGHFGNIYDGRFMDAHNAKSVYHWIVVRGAIALLKVIPQNHSDYDFIKYYTNLAFNSGINEIVENGVYRTGPAYEISTYCTYFDCEEDVLNSLTSTIYWNFKGKKGAIGSYYLYKKNNN